MISLKDKLIEVLNEYIEYCKTSYNPFHGSKGVERAEELKIQLSDADILSTIDIIEQYVSTKQKITLHNHSLMTYVVFSLILFSQQNDSKAWYEILKNSKDIGRDIESIIALDFTQNYLFLKYSQVSSVKEVSTIDRKNISQKLQSKKYTESISYDSIKKEYSKRRNLEKEMSFLEQNIRELVTKCKELQNIKYKYEIHNNGIREKVYKSDKVRNDLSVKYNLLVSEYQKLEKAFEVSTKLLDLNIGNDILTRQNIELAQNMGQKIKKAKPLGLELASIDKYTDNLEASFDDHCSKIEKLELDIERLENNVEQFNKDLRLKRGLIDAYNSKYNKSQLSGFELI